MMHTKKFLLVLVFSLLVLSLFVFVNLGCSSDISELSKETITVEEYNVDADAYPYDGGRVTGSGIYKEGTRVTVSATNKAGYEFTGWTENGIMVSRNKQYSFTVTDDRYLVANFELPSLYLRIISVTCPIGKGYRANIVAETEPGAICNIRVRYASGYSSAQGLNQKTADSQGRVSWSWKVGTRTTPGSWPITITVSDGNRSASETYYFNVY